MKYRLFYAFSGDRSYNDYNTMEEALAFIENRSYRVIFHGKDTRCLESEYDFFGISKVEENVIECKEEIEQAKKKCKDRIEALVEDELKQWRELNTEKERMEYKRLKSIYG
jgi:acetyl-CoA carboxylase alpha subunit